MQIPTDISLEQADNHLTINLRLIFLKAGKLTQIEN